MKFQRLDLSELHIPQFIYDEYPIFVELLQKYYEWLSIPGNAGSISKLQTYRDVENTPDLFLNNFLEQFFYGFDKNIQTEVDKRLIIENAIEYFKSKGTEDSLKYLFRVIFNQEVEIFYPRDLTLDLSESGWSQNNLIKVLLESETDIFATKVIGKQIIGETSNLAIFVSNVIKFTSGGLWYATLLIDDSDKKFTPKENIRLSYTDDFGSIITLTRPLVNILVGFEVTNQGQYYTPNSLISFKTSGSGIEGTAAIGDVTSGKIEEVEILDGGSGYSAGANITVNNITSNGVSLGQNAVLNIETVQNLSIDDYNLVSPGSHYKQGDTFSLSYQGSGAKLTPIVSSITGAIKAVNIISGGSGYKNPAITIQGVGTNGAITPIVNVLNKKINLISQGFGYTTVPNVSVTASPSGDNATAVATINGFIDSFVINNGGSGYTTAPEVVITGDGFGASAVALIGGGIITDILISNSGSGYTSPPIISFIGDGIGADVTATISAYVESISLTPGSGYISIPTVTIDPSPISGGDATAEMFSLSGVLVGVTVTNGGSGYKGSTILTVVDSGTISGTDAKGKILLESNGSIVDIQLSDSGTNYALDNILSIVPDSITNKTLKGIVTATTNFISDIQVTNVGTNYTTTPTILIDSPVSGVRAKAIANMKSDGISKITSTPGSGYTSEPLVTISGDGVNATAKANLGNGVISSLVLSNKGWGYTSAPSVVFTPKNTVGVIAATAHTTITGAVNSILVSTQGEYSTQPGVSIVGDGISAAANSIISGFVKTVTINNVGSGYETPPIISTDLTPSGIKTFKATTTIIGGIKPTITIDAVGSGYISSPIIDISVPQTTVGAAPVLVSNVVGTLEKILVVNGGYYSVAPTTATVTGGSGVGAVISPITAATGSGFIITGFTISNVGSGFTSIPTITITNGTQVTAPKFLTSITGTVTSITITSGGTNYAANPRALYDLPSDTTGTVPTIAVTQSGGIINSIVPSGGSKYKHSLQQCYTIANSNKISILKKYTTIDVGSVVTGSGIPANTVVTNVNDTTITVNNLITLTGKTDLTFISKPIVNITLPGQAFASVTLVSSGKINQSKIDVPGTYYNTIPGAVISDTGAGTSGAITSIFSGSLIECYVINGGSGYNIATTELKVISRDGNGSGAIVKPVIVNGRITQIQVLAGGSGYTSDPIIEIISGAIVTPTTVYNTITSGFLWRRRTQQVRSIKNIITPAGTGAVVGSVIKSSLISTTITNQGSSYTSPSITYDVPLTKQATITLEVKAGKIVGVITTAVGIGYSSARITLTSATGKGAIIYPIIKNDIIIGYTVANSGYGYDQTVTAAVTAPNIDFTNKQTKVTIKTVGSSINAITVDYVGSGYTSTPTVSVKDSNKTAKFTCKLNGSINTIVITNAGSNYTIAPVLTVTSATGINGALTANLKYKVTGVNITNRGTGYTSVSAVNFTGGTPTINAVASATIVNYINSIVLDTPGSGYKDKPVVTLVGGSPIKQGSASCVATFNVASVSLLTSGSGYTTATANITGGGGSSATATPVIINHVDSITITNPGSGYTTVPNVSFSGGGGTLTTATAHLNSTGIISELTFLNAGKNISENDIFSISSIPSLGTSASAKVESLVNDSIDEITLTDTGTNYKVGDILEIIAEPYLGTGLTFNVDSVSTGTITDLTITNSGSNYEVNDLLQLNQLENKSKDAIFKVATVSSGAPTGLTLISGGSGFALNDSLNIVSANPGSGASIQIETIDDLNLITSVSIVSGGSKYNVSDLVEIYDTVNFAKSKFKVTSVSSTGAILTLELISTIENAFNVGSIYTLNGINRGIETGLDLLVKILTLDVNSGIDTFSIINGGRNYNVGEKYTIESSMGNGSILTVASVSGSGEVLTLTLTAAGTGYEKDSYYTYKLNSGLDGTFTVSGINSGLGEILITNVGSGYSAGQTLVTVSGGDANAKVRISEIRNGNVLKSTIVNGGSGYVVGDVLSAYTTSNLHNTYLKLSVTEVNDGSITAFTMLDGGDTYTANTILETLSSGSGTGAKVKVQSVANGTLYRVDIIERGTNYIKDAIVTLTGGTLGKIKIVSVIPGGIITSITGLSGGTGYVVGDLVKTSQKLTGTNATIKVLGVNSTGGVQSSSITGDITTGSNLIENIVLDTVEVDSLAIGSSITGTGIPVDTFIVAVETSLISDSINIRLNNDCTATTSNLPITIKGYSIVTGGSGFSQYNKVYATHPVIGSGARIRVGAVSATGSILGFTYLPENIGSGYSINDRLTLVNVDTSTGGEIKVLSVYGETSSEVLDGTAVPGQINTFSVLSGGTGYSVGDYLEFSSKPRGENGQLIVKTTRNGNIKSVNISNNGIGYDIQPNLVPTSGTGASLLALGSNIGKIKSIRINNPGLNYDVVPELDFTTQGNGAASGILKSGSIFNEAGSFTSEKGQVSQRSYITDGDFYQKYSYAIKTSKSIKEYEPIIKKLFHPAGFKLFGQLLVENFTNTGVGSADINTSLNRGSVLTFDLHGGTGFNVGDQVLYYNNSTIHYQSYFTILVTEVGVTGNIIDYIIINYGASYTVGIYNSVSSTGINSELHVTSISPRGYKFRDVITFVETSNYTDQKWISAQTISGISDISNVETIKFLDNNVINDSYQILSVTSITGSFLPYETITESSTGLTGKVLDYNSTNKLLNVKFNTKPFTIGGSIVLTGSTSGTISTGTTQESLAIIYGNTQGDVEEDAKQLTSTPVSILANQKVIDWVNDSGVNISNIATKTNYALDSIIISDQPIEGFNTNSSTTVNIPLNVHGLRAGMLVSGTGIQPGTVINYISESYMILSLPATTSINNTTLTFKNS